MIRLNTRLSTEQNLNELKDFNLTPLSRVPFFVWLGERDFCLFFYDFFFRGVRLFVFMVFFRGGCFVLFWQRLYAFAALIEYVIIE